MKFFKRYMKCYNEMYSFIIILVIVLCSFVLCSIAYIVFANNVRDIRILMRPKNIPNLFLQNVGFKVYIFPIIYSIFVILEIFRVCFLANAVQYQSNQFSVDIFFSEWANSSVKYRKLMLTFTENLKKPIKVTALDFIPIDMRLFVKLINTIYSMYTVLQSFRD